MERGSSSSRRERNMKERIRRRYMKDLLTELAFRSDPHQSSKSKASIPDLLEHTTNHIKHLQEKIKELKERHAQLLKESSSDTHKKASCSRLPLLHMKSLDSTLEINLISGLDKNFMLPEIIIILQQEGAEVISVAQYTAADSVIYIIKSQAICTRIGVETSRVGQRIKDLCF